jgi:hypothetical protein
MKGDMTTRLALARNLNARLLRLADVGRDELRVLDVFVTSLERTFMDRGPLDLTKARDWRRERAIGVIDDAIAQACEALARRDDQILAVEIGLDEIADAEAIEPARFADLLGEDLPDYGTGGGGQW